MIPDASFVIRVGRADSATIEAWNRDHDLRSAIRDSVVWYYQELARRVGPQRMQQLGVEARLRQPGPLGRNRPLLARQLAAHLARRAGGLPGAAARGRAAGLGALGRNREGDPRPGRARRGVVYRGKTGSCAGATPAESHGWWVGSVENADGACTCSRRSSRAKAPPAACAGRSPRTPCARSGSCRHRPCRLRADAPQGPGLEFPEIPGGRQEDTMATGRPADTEYAPFYAGYVAPRAGGRRPGARSSASSRSCARSPRRSRRTARRIATPPTSGACAQVVGHLTDGERVFGYRAFCIQPRRAGAAARLRRERLRGPLGLRRRAARRAGRRARRACAASNLAALRRLGAADWARLGTASGKPVSVRALAYVMVGHPRHHLAILREKYGML